MKLEGIHHITAITGDAQANVDFYAGTLGLRMVKKTVNQDAPSVYHLFYADEEGSPGRRHHLLRVPRRGARARRGRDGPPDRLAGRLRRGPRLLGRAARRRRGRDLARGRLAALRRPGGPRARARGRHRPRPAADRRPPRGPGRARAPGLPRRPRVLAPTPSAARRCSRASSSSASGDGWEARGDARGGLWYYDEPPAEPGREGAGTVHHIAWASEMDEHTDWRERAIEGGARPTPVIDRFWFRSIYFREPSGVLFEIATLGPGFGVDEDPEHLGEELILPPFLEDQREQIEAALTPVVNPRTAARERERRTRPPAPRAGRRAGGRADPQPRARRRRERPLRPARRARPRAPAARASPPARRSRASRPAGATGTWCRGSATRTRSRSPAATRRSPSSRRPARRARASTGAGR